MPDRHSRIRWISQTPIPPEPDQPEPPPVEPRPEAPNPATPFLNRVGRDLTLLARQGRLKPMVGRQKELLRLQRILLRKEKNNPLILGATGVGKTALVDGLALLVAGAASPASQANPALHQARIVELSAAGIAGAMSAHSSLDEKLAILVDEADRDRTLLVYFDNLATLVGMGASGRASNFVTSILIPALSSGSLHCLGAATPDDYDRYLASETAFTRWFAPLNLEEPTEAESIELLLAALPLFEQHHQVRILPEAAEAAVRLSARHMLDRRLPDKAFDLLDEACTVVRIPGPEAAGLDGELAVGREAVSQAAAARFKIPPDKLDQDVRSRLSGLAEALHWRVTGQEGAIRRVEAGIRGAFSGLDRPGQTRHVFAFFGSTGVGKTETAKALAEFLFDSTDAMIRLDMSEYKEAYTVSRLLGSPPGYIGYEDEGTFATRLRRQPYAVVLMDEFEKAHPQVLDVFLHIFDEGRFSDARGRQIDARQAVFILTSNLFTVSQSNSHEEYEEHCESIRRSLNGTLRTEFINRINEIVLFEELDIPDLVEIARMEIASLAGRLAGQGCQLAVDEEVFHWIAAEAFDPASGARAVLRLITRQIVQPLGEILLQGSQPRTVRVTIEGGEIRLT